VDTGLIVAVHSAGDAKHAEGVRLRNALQTGKHGMVFLTDLVLAEILNYFVAKSRDRTLPDRVARELLGEDQPPWLRLVRIDERTWNLARQEFRVLSRAGLSFTDCSSIAVVKEMKLDAIVGFDSGFDGVIGRIGG
jgi:predicted nucleic acid-binding protein